jgi:hypothetical protein
LASFLQFAFPQPHPPAVAAAAIGGDQQTGGVRVTQPTDIAPALADAVHGKGGRVMIDAHAHPAGIAARS